MPSQAELSSEMRYNNQQQFGKSAGPAREAQKKRATTATARRSTHREKLEKTFKEKGFLIQTQQLESAEGATYCKFRQLKKFTRYLFRNWKDYLPEELEEARKMEAVAKMQHSTESVVGGEVMDDRLLATQGYVNGADLTEFPEPSSYVMESEAVQNPA